MAQCVVKKKGGEQCKGEAGTGKYCPIHRHKFQKRIKHGKYAQTEIMLGVPPKHLRTYQEFLKTEKPFDLSRELALLRTIFVELREAMDERRPQKVAAFLEQLTHELTRTLIGRKLNPEMSKILAEDYLIPVIYDTFVLMWGVGVTMLDPDEAKDMTYILDTISKVAERMKKIQEGVTLNININAEMLTRFLVNVVFPSVPEPERRSQIAGRARQFSVTARRTVTVPVLEDDWVEGVVYEPPPLMPSRPALPFSAEDILRELDEELIDA